MSPADGSLPLPSPATNAHNGKHSAPPIIAAEITTKANGANGSPAGSTVAPPPAREPETHGFSWGCDCPLCRNSLSLSECPATAVFWNGDNELVITQRAWPEEDQTVRIPRDRLELFLLDLKTKADE